MIISCAQNAVAGGAGHVRRLVTEDGRCFQQVVETAIAITKGCNCSPSCYSCLRNYYNQKIHDLLNRKYAYDFLENYYGELEPITNEEFENGVTLTVTPFSAPTARLIVPYDC